MVGSAWTPCVRPTMGVCLNSRARFLRTSASCDEVFAEDFGSGLDLKGLRGIDHVGGGEAVVEPAGFRADVLGDGGGEGDDVVADFGFDLVDAGDVDFAALADGLGGLGGDDAVFGEGLAGGGFDFEPHAVLVFVAPDAAHFGAGITCDQANPP